MNSVTLGTRGSKLALAQSQLVIDALRVAHPSLHVQMRIIKTTGDQAQDKSLREIGGAGVFVKEIEFALLRGEIDAAVHSAKDLPSQLPQGLMIAACLPRGDARDALVVRNDAAVAITDDPFTALPHDAKVGTGSVRRAAFLRSRRPDVIVQDMRGNVDSRLRRLVAGEFDALVLAMAGLERLARLPPSGGGLPPPGGGLPLFGGGLDDGDVRVLPIPIEHMLPAVAQGILAVEARADDARVLALLSAINHTKTHSALRAERAFLRGFDAGCQAPIAAFAVVVATRTATAHTSQTPPPTPPQWGGENVSSQWGEEYAIHLRGAVGLLDGTAFAHGAREGHVDQAEAIGARLAQRVLQAGGQTILDVMRDGAQPLQNKRIALTRTNERGESLAVKLRALGATSVSVPVIAHAPAQDADAFDATMQALCAGGYDWVALTSATAAEVIAGWLSAHDRAWPANTRIAVVGEATARACEDALGRAPDLMPERYDAVSLAAAMERHAERDVRVLLPNADIAQPALQHALVAQGIQVDRIVTYRTVCREVNESFAPADAIIFTSSSTVKCFARQFASRNMLAVCIGAQTAQAAASAGFARIVTANNATEEELIDALLCAAKEGMLNDE